MPFQINKSGTVAQIQAAINALNASDQGAVANAQLVRAKAYMLAEVTAVGGTFLQIQAYGALVSGNSSFDIQVGPVPFVNTSGEPSTNLTPPPNP